MKCEIDRLNNESNKCKNKLDECNNKINLLNTQIIEIEKDNNRIDELLLKEKLKITDNIEENRVNISNQIQLISFGIK